jgi:integrase
MSGSEAPPAGDREVALKGPDDSRFTRRTFLKGAALTAGAAAAAGALGSEELLGSLEPAEGATAAPEILIRTGLRVGDACKLGISCLVRDSQGAPYLRYRNHKMRRDAMVPVDDQLAAMIEDRQQQVRSRHPRAAVLLPRLSSCTRTRRKYPAT